MAYLDCSPLGGKRRENNKENIPVSVSYLKNILQILETNADDTDLDVVNEVFHLLNESPRNMDLFSVLNDNGWSILTILAAEGFSYLVQFAVKKYSINVNNYQERCSPLLHVAIKYGHAKLVEILLAAGAGPWLRSSLCYPNKCEATAKTGAHRSECDAVVLALKYDNMVILDLLLRKCPGRKKIKRIYNSAIWTGAVECFKFLLQKWPSYVCISSKSKRCSVLDNAFTNGSKGVCLALIDHISQNVPEIWLAHPQMVLQVLFANRSEKSSMAELTRSVFSAGLPKSVHSVATNKDGYTCLHGLCARINSDGSAEYGPECIKIAMDNGADIWPMTCHRRNVLHTLLSPRNFNRRIGAESMNIYASGINKCLEVLLLSRYAEDAVRAVDKDGKNPLAYVFDTMIRLSSQQWVVVGEVLVETCRLLAKAGAKLSGNSKSQLRLCLALHPVNHIIATLSGWINWNTTESSPETTEAIINQVVSLLEMLLSEKVIDAQPFLPLVYKQIVIMANISDEISLKYSDLAKLPLLLMVHGANPNSCAVFTNEEDNECPAAADFIFYVSRTVLLQCRQGRKDVVDLLGPLRLALYQPWVNKLSKEIIHTIDTELNVYQVDADAEFVIRQYLLAPRELKNICGLQILKTVTWNFSKVSRLPLPSAIRKYLKNIFQ